MADEAKKPEAESEAGKLGRRIGGLFGKLRAKAQSVIDDPQAALAAVKAKAAEIGEKIEKGAQEFEKDPKGSFKAAVDKAGAAIDTGIEVVAAAANKALGEEKPAAAEPKEAPKAPEAKGPTGPVAP